MFTALDGYAALDTVLINVLRLHCTTALYCTSLILSSTFTGTVSHELLLSAARCGATMRNIYSTVVRYGTVRYRRVRYYIVCDATSSS